MKYAEQDDSQPLISHLVELRSRLLRSLLVVLVLFLCALPFAREIYQFLALPLHAHLPGDMIATDITSPLLAPLKLTFFAAFCVAMPYVLHQIWGFIAPGLYRSEARLAVPILISSVVLFFAGIAFAYFAVFPLVFGFFVSIAPEGVQVMTDINSYLGFVLKMFVAFALAFEIPVVIVLLVAAGVVSYQSLASKRAYIIVGCFVVGMLMTPPDVISQLLLATPMWLLFEAGLLVARLITKNRPNPDTDSDTTTDVADTNTPD